jgi:hypothetical protein
MSDIRAYFPGGAAQLSKRNDPEGEPSALPSNKVPAEPDAERQYVATSPSGAKVNIPKELFVALSDFIKTRKTPGSIIIQFRGGEIICVEAVAKKTYRNSQT